MPGRPQTQYQYKNEDDPTKVADQFGISPQQLIQANPGGYPFSQGQTLNIPLNFQYSSPVGPQPAPIGPQPYGTNSFLGAGGLRPNVGPNLNTGITGVPPVGYGAPLRPAAPTQAGTGSFMSGSGQNVGTYYNNNIMALNTTPTQTPSTGAAQQPLGGIRPTPAGNTDFNMTQAAQYNAANNIPFLQQKRWDPKRRKYISVGQWLKQSRRRGGRGGGGGGGSAVGQPIQQEEKKQEYAMANAIIDFGVSAG